MSQPMPQPGKEFVFPRLVAEIERRNRKDSGVGSVHHNPKPWLYLPSELGLAS